MLYLPQLGSILAENVQQYPSLRNRVIRMLEPLSAPNESSNWYDEQPDMIEEDKKPTKTMVKTAAKIELKQVNLDLAGQRVLHHWQVTVESGEHIAIVGKSGSGKSSLMGLLLGWHKPAHGGEVLVDGQLYHGKRIAALRSELVWVDPQVQIWDNTLQQNINYGKQHNSPVPPAVFTQAELLDIIENLPDGQYSSLGENGARLSGGEAQRVRLARGLNKLFDQQTPRLVILDEPFRGLSQDARQRLLTKVRVLFKDVTLLFISHHVADTLDFKRVWVVADGKLTEDAAPERLLSNIHSRYAKLIDQEKQARALLLDNPQWQKMTIDNGQLH